MSSPRVLCTSTSTLATIVSRVVLITGANSGIGFQIVRALCSSDQAYNIIVGGRSLSKAQDAISSAEKEFLSSRSQFFPIQVNIEHDDSIKRAFDEVQSKFGKLDALVNNAGAQLDQQLAAGKLTERDMCNQTWNINTVGTQVMTSTFMPLLLQSSDPRLLFITSGTPTLAGTEDLALPINRHPPKGWPKKGGLSIPAYRSAKCGMNMLMREWAPHAEGRRGESVVHLSRLPGHGPWWESGGRKGKWEPAIRR